MLLCWHEILVCTVTVSDKGRMSCGNKLALGEPLAAVLSLDAVHYVQAAVDAFVNILIATHVTGCQKLQADILEVVVAHVNALQSNLHLQGLTLSTTFLSNPDVACCCEVHATHQASGMAWSTMYKLHKQAMMLIETASHIILDV